MSWCIASTDTAQWETVLWHKPSVNNSANSMRKWSKTLLKIRILMLSNQFFFFSTCSVCTYFFHLRLPNSGKPWVLVQTLFTCCRNKRLRTTQTTRKPFTAFLFLSLFLLNSILNSIFAFGERCILYLSFCSSSGLSFCFVLFYDRDWIGFPPKMPWRVTLVTAKNIIRCYHARIHVCARERECVWYWVQKRLHSLVRDYAV